MVKRAFFILNLVALLLAMGWMINSFDWEPIIVFVTLLGTFLTLIFKQDDSKKNSADIELFRRFNEDLPIYNIEFIEQSSLKSPFLRSNLDPFFHFESTWKDVHHTFFNKKLENCKTKLHNSIYKFISLVAINTFPTNNQNVSCIPKEWELNDKQRYDKVTKNIDEVQDEVVKDYNVFVKRARQTLKV